MDDDLKKKLEEQFKNDFNMLHEQVKHLTNEELEDHINTLQEALRRAKVELIAIQFEIQERKHHAG